MSPRRTAGRDSTADLIEVGRGSLPPLSAPRPGSLRQAWETAWAYSDRHGAGSGAVALNAFLALHRAYPEARLHRADVEARLRGTDYASKRPA